MRRPRRRSRSRAKAEESNSAGEQSPEAIAVRNAELADALALAAERSDEIEIAARQILKGLDAPRSVIAGDATVSRLMENLADSTRQLHSEAAELTRRISGIRHQLSLDETRPAKAIAPSSPGAEEPGAEEAASEPPPTLEPAEPPSAGVRVLVAQMAAIGATPLEIEARLREGFGIRNARDVVEQVLDGGRDARE